MDRFILHEIYGMSAEDRKRFDLGQYADDGSILEDTVTGETYMDGWEPEDATFIRDLGWVPALLNTLAEETTTQRAEVERLTALVERQRLVLLAEQGIAEGAPSDRWTWGIIDEEGGIGWKRRTAGGMIFAWGRGVELGSRGQPSEPHPGGWAEWTTNEDGDLDDEIARATDALWNTLDAMEAAEAAHPSTPETDRP